MENELSAGIDLVLEASRQLRLGCIPSGSLRTGHRVNFDLTDGNKEIRMALGHDFVTDLPGTKEFQSALREYLSAIALRFREQSFNEYMTLSGIPIRFEIRFPFRRSVSGASVYSVWVVVRSGWDEVLESNFTVSITDTVAVNLASLESVITESLVVNSVRKYLDTKKVKFHREAAGVQDIVIGSSAFDWKPKKFTFHKCNEEQVEGFLIRKVYWLGFRRGTSANWVCISDPYDAEYLGTNRMRLQQVAAIAAANGYLHLDSSGIYAQTSNKLLVARKEFDKERDAYLTTPYEEPPLVGQIIPQYDVFICHASEDKPYVDPLVQALLAAGITVWFDKTRLEWGDDLRSSIDLGVSTCRYGIVVFSKAFLNKKKWTEHELSALFAREEAGKKVILPIWHGITREDLLQYSPAFADRLAKISSNDSYDVIVSSLLTMLGRKKN
jgi:hypothetical protein